MKFISPSSTSVLKPFVTSALAVAFGIASAHAAITFGPQNTSSTSTTHEYLNSYNSWIVADLSDVDFPVPLEVTTSLSHGFWTQELTFPSGFPTLTTGQTFNLQELLVFTGGDRPLEFWSQTIITPDWQWESASIFDSNTSEALSGLAVGIDGATVNFSFDALAPGTSLIVLKELKYTGPDGPATSLTIQAVPEPGSAMLGLIGVTTLFIRKRRF